MPKAINVDLDAPVVASKLSTTQTEPKTVKPSEVLEETYGLTTEEVAQATYDNARKVFGLD